MDVPLTQNIFQQIQNIPITGVFVYTVSEDTRDCEDSPSYDADQVGCGKANIYFKSPQGLDKIFPH